MARRKQSPPSVIVEAVLWNDAYYSVRSLLDTSPMMNHTVGFLVHEDEKQIILANEIRATDDWSNDEMDFTKIPKQMIIARQSLGEVIVAPDGT